MLFVYADMKRNHRQTTMHRGGRRGRLSVPKYKRPEGGSTVVAYIT